MLEARLTAAMFSHPGLVRRRNEDACLFDLEVGIFAVCDGVGGAAGGEIASDLACRTAIYGFRQSRDAGRSVEDRLLESVHLANRRVFREAQQREGLRGMATTIVALGVGEAAEEALGEGVEASPALWIANVGDSRCYVLRDGVLHQLTADHSVVEEQVRTGEMTREEASISPFRNVITRALGCDPEVEVDLQRVVARAGDLYLLTTDGLMRELDDVEIARVLWRRPADSLLPGEPEPLADLQVRLERLVSAALAHGGGDNITCILVQVDRRGARDAS